MLTLHGIPLADSMAKHAPAWPDDPKPPERRQWGILSTYPAGHKNAGQTVCSGCYYSLDGAVRLAKTAQQHGRIDVRLLAKDAVWL